MKNKERLIKTQSVFLEKFKENGLMKLINSKEIGKKDTRVIFLDCIQTFSDFFQKSVMLRAVFTEPDSVFHKLANEHLSEEFGHNIDLLADRNNRPAHFDPILESCAAWFCWKMLSLDNIEKTVLMHWVLESSAYVFFTSAHTVMERYKETDYFKIHAEADEKHKDIETSFLEGLREEECERLLNVLDQGWKILFTTCDRIAEITLLNHQEQH
jgi:hypothetical protein